MSSIVFPFNEGIPSAGTLGLTKPLVVLETAPLIAVVDNVGATDALKVVLGAGTAKAGALVVVEADGASAEDAVFPKRLGVAEAGLEGPPKREGVSVGFVVVVLAPPKRDGAVVPGVDCPPNSPPVVVPPGVDNVKPGVAAVVVFKVGFGAPKRPPESPGVALVVAVVLGVPKRGAAGVDVPSGLAGVADVEVPKSPPAAGAPGVNDAPPNKLGVAPPAKVGPGLLPAAGVAPKENPDGVPPLGFVAGAGVPNPKDGAGVEAAAGVVPNEKPPLGVPAAEPKEKAGLLPLLLLLLLLLPCPAAPPPKLNAAASYVSLLKTLIHGNEGLPMSSFWIF